LQSTVRVEVPFQDADPTGYAWHGNYFRYYDTARVALLAKLEFGYRQMAGVGQIWPIVDTRVRYLHSLPFGSTVTVSAQLVEWEFRLRIYYEIHAADGKRVNEAYTDQVPVAVPSEELIIGVPEEVQARVRSLIG
jgi:acyl-CoA thioester hydrolase